MELSLSAQRALCSNSNLIYRPSAYVTIYVPEDYRNIENVYRKLQESSLYSFNHCVSEDDSMCVAYTFQRVH